MNGRLARALRRKSGLADFVSWSRITRYTEYHARAKAVNLYRREKRAATRPTSPGRAASPFPLALKRARKAVGRRAAALVRYEAQARELGRGRVVTLEEARALLLRGLRG